jgi:hypothetical protein
MRLPYKLLGDTLVTPLDCRATLRLPNQRIEAMRLPYNLLGDTH